MRGLSLKRSVIVGYGIATAVVILAWLVRLGQVALLEPNAIPSTPFLTFFVAIMLAGWYGGLGPGLWATFLSAIISNFFFIQPSEAFGIRNLNDFVNIALFIFEGSLISWCCETLHDSIRKAKQEIHEREQSEQRQLFLGEASRNFATSLSYQTTVQNATRIALPFLAEYCLVYLLQDDQQTILLMPVIYQNQNIQELEQIKLQFEELEETQPIRQALKSGNSIRVEKLTGDLFPTFNGASKAIETLKNLKGNSALFVPLSARGNKLGVMHLVGATPRQAYSPADLTLAEELARRIALALDNASLYEAEQKARLASVRLQSLTVELAEALTPNQVATIVLKQSIAVLKATAGLVALLDKNENIFEVVVNSGVGAESLREWERFKLEVSPRIAQVVSTQEPIWCEDLDAPLAEGMMAWSPPPFFEKNKAWAVIPLIVKKGVIGIISIHIDTPCKFSEDDKVLVLTLAQQCAQALERTRLYEAESQARAVAEASQAQQAELLALLDTSLASAPVGLAFLDSRLRYVRLNEAIARMNNRTIEEHVGRVITDVLPDTPPWLIDTMHAVLQTGQPQTDLEVSRVDKNNPLLVTHFLVSYYPVSIPERHTLGLGIVLMDITARKQAEENERLLSDVSRILGSSFEYRDTLGEVARLIVETIAQGCFIYLFEGETKLLPKLVGVAHFNANQEQRLQTFLPQLFQNSDDTSSQFFRNQLKFYPEVEQLSPEEVGVQLSTLFREFEVQSFISLPLVSRQRQLGVLGLFSTKSGGQLQNKDLVVTTELALRMALAIDNARLYEEAVAAVENREEFLSVAAHELRTPITSLRGYAQLLANQLAQTGTLDPQRVCRALKTINYQTEKLAALVSQLLDVSRIEAGRLKLELRNTDLVKLLENVISLVQNGPISSNIILNAPDTLPILADSTRLEQVVINILDNAVKFSPRNSPIKVDLTLTADKQVYLAVSDNGPGIAPEMRDHIFDRFYQVQTRNSTQGMGLGLYITRQIVELHQGQIRAEFPEEGGTRMVVQLPTGL